MLSLIDKDVLNNYNILIEIADKYNNLNKSYKAKYPKPNKDKIGKNKYSTLNQYINSKNIWVSTLSLLKELNKNNINIDDYIKTMIGNWDYIRFYLFIKNLYPLPKVIFSEKGIFIYNSIVRNKEKVNNNNKDKVINKITIDNYNSNMLKLNNMIKAHKQLSDLDILTIFRNEFDDDFIKKYINSLE